MAMKLDVGKLGRAFAQQMTDLAIGVLTGTVQEQPPTPEEQALRDQLRAEKTVWEQAKAEGRVRVRHIPPPADNWDDGPMRDHWGRWEQYIEGTDLVCPWPDYGWSVTLPNEEGNE